MPANPAPTMKREASALLRLAAPLFIAQLAQMGTGVVDTIMAGHYSSVDLAAIAIGYNIWLPVYLFFLGTMLATTAMVAQDFGAGNRDSIRSLLPQTLWVAIALGCVAAPLCYFSSPLLAQLQLDADTHSKSLGYLQATAFGLPAAAAFQALRCHIQGVGINRPFAIASVIGFFANIPLNYAFIYGKWGLPALGAAGCGWATAVSMWLGPVLIGIYMARSGALKDYLPPLRIVMPDFSVISRVLRLGLPVGLMFFFEVAVFSIMGLMVATLGNAAMAAHQISMNIWDVIYMPLVSLGMAMTTRVGHAIGAQDRPGVSLAVRTGALITLAVGFSITAILLLFPEWIARAYTDDKTILLMSLSLVRLASVFIIFDAVQIVASFSLRAFNDNKYPFIVMCIAYWLVALPLGYYLGLVVTDDALTGTMGFWKAMVVGITIVAVLVSWRLRRVLQKPLPLVAGS